MLLADDQALVRAGFRALLDAQDDIEVVAEADDREEAVQLARTLQPDVVWLTDFGSNAIVRFDPYTERFRVIRLSSSPAEVRSSWAVPTRYGARIRSG